MWRMALEVKDDSPVLYQNLGVVNAGLWRLEEARLHLQRVLELDDAYVEAHFNFGNLSYKGGKLMRHMPLGAKLSNWMGNMPELGRGWAMFTIIGRIGRWL